MDTRGGNPSGGSVSLVAMPTTPITVVGGGLAGLVAAVSAAEAGTGVDLYEAHRFLGGRARSTPEPFVANLGPHVLYADGPFWAWLKEHDLLPTYRRPPLTGVRFRWQGESRKTPPKAFLQGLKLLRHRDAPFDVDFRTWAASEVGEDAAEVMSRFAAVNTFTLDPGALSAAFVWERTRRAFHVPPAARYLVGGWTSLVVALERRAAERGVRIHLSSPIDAVPEDRPVIVATELPAARRLLGDSSLHWHSGRTALLDIGMRARRGDPFVVSDLDAAGWVERFSAPDPTLAPKEHDVVQVQVPTKDGEPLGEAVTRAEALLDSGYEGWRDREVWRRRSLADARTGALDPPGTTWRDRPAVDRGGGVFLCGDSVAAPGLLSEVSWASGIAAADGAVQASRRWTSSRPTPVPAGPTVNAG